MQLAGAGFPEAGLHTAKIDHFVKSPSFIYMRCQEVKKLMSIFYHSLGYKSGFLGAWEVCTVSTLNAFSVRTELHKVTFPQKTAVCYCRLQ